jgi:Tol biopolymer transport system component
VTADTSQSFHPVWSPDGSQIAFLRATGSQTLAIFTIPLVGGGERRWADFRTGATFWFDWSGNGKFFAAAEPDASGGPPGIVLISLATGEKRRVTSPPAGWRGDSEPVFSPDSSHLAFRRTTQGSGHEDIYTVPVAGGPLTRITFDDHTISGLTFTPDGGLLFSSRRQASIGSLWWATARGRSLAHVTPATVAAVAPAVSRDGKHFAFMRLLYDANIWQVAADGSGPAKLLIDSDLTDTSPRFSPDGQHVVFQSDRSGSSEIWVSDANGGSPARLTTGQGDEVGNPIWSPDGRTIAFEWHPANKSGIWVVASDGGGLKAIATSAHRTVEPSWSHDGRFVYFVAGYGFDSKIWKVPASGGAVTAVGQVAGSSPLESPDGRYLYVFRRGEIWRVALQGGMPSGSERRILGGLNAAGDWGNWIPTDQGIYYLRRMEHGTQIEYLDIDTGSVRVVHTLTKPPVFGERGLALSPDGKVLLFCQVDLDGSDIFVQ